MSFAPGYERTSNPMLGAPVGRQGDDDVGLGSESGPQAPSRVMTMDECGVRKPAVLKRPVLASPGISS